MTCIRTSSLLISLLLLAVAAPAGASDVSVELGAASGFVIENSGASVERLRVDEATGNISRNGALFVHTTGTDSTFVGDGAGNPATTGNFNSAFGTNALRDNTTGGTNSAFGHDALRNNTTGFGNSAFGYRALRYNTTSGQNAAFGREALEHNGTGERNSAFGSWALNHNSAGVSNSAFGRGALQDNTSGNRNVAIGDYAGRHNTGSDNIYIANDGAAFESGKIKIGNSAHTETFIDGIFANSALGGAVVLINGSNELHTVVSSARFKEAVQDLGDASEVLMQLRPVSFRYRGEVVGGDPPREYGLIAEEVAESPRSWSSRTPRGSPTRSATTCCRPCC